MELRDERLRTYTRYRQQVGAVDPDSGLAVDVPDAVDQVEVDLQPDQQVSFTDDSGQPLRRGGFIGFAYDELRHGDQLDTPHGRLEVVTAYLWDDLDTPHYEASLRLA